MLWLSQIKLRAVRLNSKNFVLKGFRIIKAVVTIQIRKGWIEIEGICGIIQIGGLISCSIMLENSKQGYLGKDIIERG